MLALREKCIHPVTKKPYILDSSGGRDNSPEGHQVVLTHFPGSRTSRDKYLPAGSYPVVARLWKYLADWHSFKRAVSHTASSPTLPVKRTGGIIWKRIQRIWLS